MRAAGFQLVTFGRELTAEDKARVIALNTEWDAVRLWVRMAVWDYAREIATRPCSFPILRQRVAARPTLTVGSMVPRAILTSQAGLPTVDSTQAGTIHYGRTTALCA